MSSRWRLKRPDHSTVVSYLALFVALGGTTAYAANTIGSDDVRDGSLRSRDIKNGQVKKADIGRNQVTTSKIKTGNVRTTDILDGSVFTDDLADGAVNSAKVSDESLTSADLATNSATATEIAGNSIDGAKVANNSLTTSDIAGAASNGAVSFSGVANGRCSQVTLSVSGAQVGEVPLVATNGAIQNGVLLYAMRVESAGHVEASICNFSGTSMTPSSACRSGSSRSADL